MELHLRFEKARDLFRAYPEIEDDMDARPKGHTSLEFLEFLEASRAPEEALIYLSYLLPKRQAVWWGVECISEATGAMSTADHRIADSVVAWIGAPTQRNRRAAVLAAQRVRPTSSAAWLGHAVGASVTTSDDEAPPPSAPTFLAHRYVSFSVVRAFRSVDMRRRSSVLHGFIAAGLRTQYRETPKFESPVEPRAFRLDNVENIGLDQMKRMPPSRVPETTLVARPRMFEAATDG